jgi:hypothetical protein
MNEFLANNGMMKALDSPYSPNRGPCEFFLLDHPKERLTARPFEDPDQMFMDINQICASTAKVIVEKVLNDWRGRVAKCLVAQSGLEEHT